MSSYIFDKEMMKRCLEANGWHTLWNDDNWVNDDMVNPDMAGTDIFVAFIILLKSKNMLCD